MFLYLTPSLSLKYIFSSALSLLFLVVSLLARGNHMSICLEMDQYWQPKDPYHTSQGTEFLPSPIFCDKLRFDVDPGAATLSVSLSH